MKHITSDLSGVRLGQAILMNAALRAQLLDRLAVADGPVTHIPHDPLVEPELDDLPVVSLLVGEEGSGTVIHLVIGDMGVAVGQGLRNLRRAIFLQELAAPLPHADTRVALVLPPERIAEEWCAVREFPHWIDARKALAVTAI